MAILEIKNFRKKYPEYDDLSDLELSEALAKKYPEYGDLPGKVKAETAPYEQLGVQQPFEPHRFPGPVGQLQDLFQKRPQPLPTPESLPAVTDAEIKAPPGIVERWVTQLKRKGSAVARGLVGDIPVVRKILPEGVQEYPSVGGFDKAAEIVPRFARDIALLGGVGAGTQALGKLPKAKQAAEAISKIPKVGKVLRAALPEAAAGATLMGLSAGSEEPKEIAKRAATGAVTFPLFIPLGKLGVKLGVKSYKFFTPKIIQDKMAQAGRKVSQVIGLSVPQTKASQLIKENYGEVQTGLLESELFARSIEKNLSEQERKLIPFVLERVFPKDIRQTLLRDKKIRGRFKSVIKPMAEKIKNYFNERHEFLVKEFGDDVGFWENYAPHLWDISKNKASEVASRFVTKNPFTKKRFIATLKEGMKPVSEGGLGLTPKELDIAKLIRTYDSFAVRSTANVKFVNELMKMVDENGVRMVQGIAEAPESWKTVNHPALRKVIARFLKGKGKGDEAGKLLLNKVPVRVHPEIAEEVNALLGSRWENARLLEALNSGSKFLTLSFSLFHPIALSESSTAAGLFKDVLKAWNPIKIIRAMKKGNKAIFDNIPLSKEALKDTLNLGGIQDVQSNLLMETLKAAEKNLAGYNPLKMAAKGGAVTLRKALEFNNRFLWDYLHPTLKLSAYQKLKQDMIKKYPELNTDLVGREVAQFVNDTFGGQVWQLLGKSPQWKQVAHLLMLSPDWNLSTFRQAMSPFGVGATHPLTKKIRQELGEDFWRRAIVMFGAGTNVLNYVTSKAHTGKGRMMWENTPNHKTELFIGHNKDGSEKYVRWGKQFREVPEFLNDPLNFAARKLSPVARQAMIQLTGESPTGFETEIKEHDFWSEGGLVARLEQLARMPVPISAQNIARETGDWQKLVYGAAFPIKKGMTAYKARELFDKAFNIPDDETRVARVREVSIGALRNNLDALKLFKQTIAMRKSEKTKAYKKDAIKAWEVLRNTPQEQREEKLLSIIPRHKIDEGFMTQVGKLFQMDAEVQKQKQLFGVK